MSGLANRLALSFAAHRRGDSDLAYDLFLAAAEAQVSNPETAAAGDLAAVLATALTVQPLVEEQQPLVDNIRPLSVPINPADFVSDVPLVPIGQPVPTGVVTPTPTLPVSSPQAPVDAPPPAVRPLPGALATLQSLLG